MKLRAVLALMIGVVLLTLAGSVVSPDRANASGLMPAGEEQPVCTGETAGDDSLNHAGVIIVFPDGTDSYCVTFEESEISGAELLRRTGLSLVLSGFGGLGAGVCRIDSVGCSEPGNCWCQCRGADCHYWTYYEFEGEEWRFLPIGASQRRVRDGDVDGWVWGNGRTPPGIESLGRFCAAFEPTPVPTSTPVPVRSTSPPQAAPTSPSGQVTSSTPAGPGTVEPLATAVAPGTPALGATGATRVATETPARQVLRQSSRPTNEADDDVRLSGDDGDGDLPIGLIWFGAVAGGIALVGGGVAARRKFRGG